MEWQKIGGPGYQFVGADRKLYGLTPDRHGVAEYSWGCRDWIDTAGTAVSLTGGGTQLYAISSNFQLYRYNGEPGNWTALPGAAHQLVSVGDRIYRLTVERTAVEVYDTGTQAWVPIGGPMVSLIGGGTQLYAIEPTGFNILHYHEVRNSWEQIGGPGYQFVGVGDTVYGLTPDRSAVAKYNGSVAGWGPIGGPMISLLGGGDSLYGIDPTTFALMLYSDADGTWSAFSEPAREFVAVGARVCRIESNGDIYSSS